MSTPSRHSPVVIITRPRAQAELLAAQLHQHQLSSFIFPLLEIQPLSDNNSLHQALAKLEQFSLAIFISPTATDIALKTYYATTTTPWPIPIAVLGPGSIASLERNGINTKQHQIISPATDPHNNDDQFDSEALLLALEKNGLNHSQLHGKRILLLRGHGGRKLLIDQLRQAGAQLTVVEMYRRCSPTPSQDTWQALKKVLAAPHCWLLTSVEAIKNLQEMRLSQPSLTLDTALVCHSRIAKAAHQAGFAQQISINSNSLIDALQHLRFAGTQHHSQ